MEKPSDPIQVVFNRSNKPECIHYAHAALCDVQGQLIRGWGNPYYETFWRSAAKPFQVLTLLMNENAQKWNFTVEEIAVMASSHSGEEEHVETVRKILTKIGYSESLLECGIMVPFHLKNTLQESLSSFTFSPIQHMCSGKHAMMLALANALEVDPTNYRDSKHPVQVAIKNEIARSIDFPVDYISEGLDGCGTPVFWMDLTAMARAYAKLVAPEKAFLAAEFEKALQTVQNAVKTVPFMVGGTNRFETDLMLKTSSSLLTKSGADGVFCIANVDTGEGLALKIVDGHSESIAPAMLSILKEINWISNEIYEELWAKYVPQRYNDRNQMIGDIKVVL